MGFFDLFKKDTQKFETQPEEVKTIDVLLRKAQGGDPDAMFELGDLYEQESNYQEAEQWFLKAIEKGHATAKYYLALDYSAGMGGPLKMATAVQYLTELVDEGYETYTKDLGYIYSNSSNKRHPILKEYYDLKKAEEYYLRAIKTKSEMRWVAAVHELGVLYAGTHLYAHLDNDIQDAVKAAYCLYVASVEGEYSRDDFFKVVESANLKIPRELLVNWEKDFSEKEYTF